MGAIGVGVSMISIGVGMVGISDSWCLDLNSLDNRLDNWSSVYEWVIVSIGKIPGVSLRVSFSFSIGITLLSGLSFNCWGFFSSNSGNGKWKSMSIKAMSIDTSIGVSSIIGVSSMSIGIGNWGGFNFSRLYYNRLDNWSMDNMVGS